MARTTTVIVALLMAVGCVVAMLPAQESSRRRASAYSAPSGDSLPAATSGATGQEPGLIPLPVDPAASAVPPAEMPPGPDEPQSVLARRPAGGSLSDQLRASGGAAADDYSGLPPAGEALAADAPAFAPAPDNPLPYQPAEVASVPRGRLPAASVPLPQNELAPAPPAPPAAFQPVSQPAAELPAEPAAELPAEPEAPRSILKRPLSSVSTPTKPAVTAPATPVIPSQPLGSGSSRRTITAPSSATPLGGRPIESRTPATILDDAEVRSITGMALTARSPALRVDVAGPKGINVGKPASYVISLSNEGESAAQEVQLRLALPGFVTVTGSHATSGEAMMHADAAGAPRLVWNVPTIAGRGHETLRLQLVASEGQNFDFGVEFASRPASAQAAVVVKQAQLQLSLSGPAAMTFGEEKVFTLTVSNPGNGDAENVSINLAAGQGRSQQIEVGMIPAGQRKDVSVQIVASQAGEMELRAVATADGDLSAEGAGKVIVRKAELAVAVQGPQLKYAGTDAGYIVTIQNSGNAPAENVLVALALPTAAKYIGGVDGATAAQGMLKWKIPSLAAGTERTFEVNTQLFAAGVNRLVVQAQATGGIVASGEVQTEVEAAPDLKLVVNDPAGPLPTSEHAVYEVQVMNRGSQSAEQVKIVMQFSDGIEPVAFDGCEAKIVPGQVVCQPLPQLGAGEQVTLKIKAKAGRGGTHQFRVEVTSNDQESRLVSEGTTRFFSEVSRPGAASGAASTARKPSSFVPSGTIQR